MKIPTSFSPAALFGIAFTVGAVIATPLAILQLQQTQDTRSRADEVNMRDNTISQLKLSKQGYYGATQTVSFTNTAPNLPENTVNVKPKDLQTGKTVTMNNVKGGETRTAVIDTAASDINAGTVDFEVTWANGRSGKSNKRASYKPVSNCKPIAPSPTKKPTPTPTKKVTPTPSYKLTPTPTKKLTPTPTYKLTPTPTKKLTPTYPPTPTKKLTITPTYPPSATYPPSVTYLPTATKVPTPTICPTLGPVQNVRIECPNCPY